MRLIKVLLNDVSTIFSALAYNPFTISGKINTLALRETIWFDNECLLSFQGFSIFIYELISEISAFLW